MVGEVTQPPYFDVFLGVYKDSDLPGAYSGPLPKIPTLTDGLMFIIFTYKNEFPTLSA